MRSQVDVAKQKRPVKEIRIADGGWQAESWIAHVLKAFPQLASECQKPGRFLAEGNPLDRLEKIGSRRRSAQKRPILVVPLESIRGPLRRGSLCVRNTGNARYQHRDTLCASTRQEASGCSRRWPVVYWHLTE